MKTMKRLLSSLLAVMLMASMLVVPANAAGDYTITINNTADDHTFEAYQIFTGTLSGRVLSNIVWGEGVDGPALLAALKADSSPLKSKFADCADADDVARAMEAKTWNNADTDAFAKIVNNHLIAAKKVVSVGTSKAPDPGVKAPYTLTVPGGYYFIRDITDVTGDYDSITKYMIEVTDNSTISPKVELPKLAKAVALTQDGTYSEAVSTNVGDTVFFRLTATLNSRVNDFPEYYLKFEDTLPTGLAFKEIASVKVSDHAIDFEANEYGFEKSVAGNPITFTLPKAKTAVTEQTHASVNANDTVEIIFSATVQNTIGINAVAGNTNKAVLYYSSNPNTTTDTYDDALAKTSEATAKVYSYALVVKKVDAAAPTTTALANAKFLLYRMVDSTKYYLKVSSDKNEWVTNSAEASTLISGADGYITVSGLRKDTYYLQETEAPETYNKTNDIVDVTIQAEFNKETGVVKNFNASVTGHGVADLYSADETSGTVTVYFANSKGATLPETGGMGTTIFYIVGAALMIGAGAVLVTKKRTQK